MGGLLLCGALAGAIGKLAVLPFDTVKRRMQVIGFEQARRPFGRVEHYRNAVHCVRRIVTVEGVRGLFKGAAPSLLKASVSSATMFAVYQWSSTRLATL